MKELTYKEKMFKNLNVAYSINYVVLQNIELLKRASIEPEMQSSFLGLQSPFDKNYFDAMFDKFAEIRNKYFANIRSFFAVGTFSQQFQGNIEYLLSLYNETFGKNVKPAEIVSDKDIKDWDRFNQICDDIHSLGFHSGIENINLMFSLSHFLEFYTDHKDWISALEIFDTLETDITSYGNKAINYGKPAHPNVLRVNSGDFSSYLSTIQAIIDTKTAEVQKKYKHKNQLELEELEKLDAENYTLKSLKSLTDRIQERIKLSNTNTIELGSFFTKIKFKFLPYSKDGFKVENVYVHRYEIMDLVSMLSFFPELEEYSKQLSTQFLNEETDHNQEKTRENL